MAGPRLTASEESLLEGAVRQISSAQGKPSGGRSLRPDGSVIVRVKVPVEKRKRPDLHESAPEWEFPSIHGLVESGEIWGWELESRTATHMVVRVIASSAKVNAVLRRQDVEAL